MLDGLTSVEVLQSVRVYMYGPSALWSTDIGNMIFKSWERVSISWERVSTCKSLLLWERVDSKSFL